MTLESRMTIPARTAEWQCLRCDTTNRKLVPATAVEADDRCTHCGAPHHLQVGPTNVRWVARLSR